MLDASEERANERLNASHMAVSKSISNLMGDTQRQLTEIQSTGRSTLDQVSKIIDRVTMLEMWKAVHTTESAGTSQAVAEIKSTLSRLNWLLITAVVVALLNLIIKT